MATHVIKIVIIILILVGVVFLLLTIVEDDSSIVNNAPTEALDGEQKISDKEKKSFENVLFSDVEVEKIISEAENDVDESGYIGYEPGKFLNLVGEAYFDPGYKVGLSLSWDPVPGAVKYLVTHWRLNDAGWAAPVVTTTELSSGSGTHPNALALEPLQGCYYRVGVVAALDEEGNALDRGLVAICEIGYAYHPELR